MVDHRWRDLDKHDWRRPDVVSCLRLTAGNRPSPGPGRQARKRMQPNRGHLGAVVLPARTYIPHLVHRGSNGQHSTKLTGHVDGEAAVEVSLKSKTCAGGAPCLDNLVERDVMRAVAARGHPGHVDRFARRDHVALDAGDLDQPLDWVAGGVQGCVRRRSRRRSPPVRLCRRGSRRDRRPPWRPRNRPRPGSRLRLRKSRRVLCRASRWRGGQEEADRGVVGVRLPAGV